MGPHINRTNTSPYAHMAARSSCALCMMLLKVRASASLAAFGIEAMMSNLGDRGGRGEGEWGRGRA